MIEHLNKPTTGLPTPAKAWKAKAGRPGFLRFAQDFGRRLERRLSASTSLRSG